MTTPSMTSDLDIARLARVQELLRGAAMTIQEVADAIGMTKPSGRAYVLYLYDLGDVYIEHYGMTGPNHVGKPCKYYRWGDHDDAPESLIRPRTPMPPPQPDPLMWAIFGKAVGDLSAVQLGGFS